jgi:pimeloyl-ACP methyl ester carboxylesterase
LASATKPATRREAGLVRAGGREIAFERITPSVVRPGPPLVFLHEGLGCIGFWRDFPDALCHRLGLTGLAYDRWGYGRSEPFDRPRRVDYLRDEAELFLPDLLTACGIERPVLIGHSDGGSIALLYAAAYPERVCALITEAAHVILEDVTLAGIRSAVEAWRSGELRARLERHHGAKAESVFRSWAECWLSAEFRDWTIEAVLPRIRAPLLVLQGSDDQYGTAAQVEIIARGVAGPCEARLLPGCRHVPHHEAREAVLDLMARFIAEHACVQPVDPPLASA